MDIKKETPIQIRPASTVILVREHERELQVYLLRRSTGSGFFPGSYVFPGGALTLHERDWEFWQQHIDLPPDALLKAFGSGLAVAGIIAYMVKRFDTRFYVAIMPEGQECIPDDVETVHGLWVSPGKGLQANMLGEIPLSPPTLVTLHELLRVETLDSLSKGIRSGSWGNPRLPIYMKLGKGAVIMQPWDPQYGKEIDIDPDELQAKMMPAGEPFSRLWLNQGIWRPVRISTN